MDLINVTHLDQLVTYVGKLERRVRSLEAAQQAAELAEGQSTARRRPRRAPASADQAPADE